MTTLLERSSPTARGVAFARSLTDIPYSKAIFRILDQMLPLQQEEKDSRIQNIDISVYFEARYKAVDREIEACGVRQIFELASGFSPRGIACSAGSDWVVAETDLPQMLSAKMEIVDALIESAAITPRPNLHWISGDVISELVFAQAAQIFRPEPVAIVCEGLLRYLSHADKALLARHIHRFLKAFGGVWITPDADIVEDETECAACAERLSRVGADIRSNLFETRSQMMDFFDGLGFQVEDKPLMTALPELSTLHTPGVQQSLALRFVNIRSILVLRAR